ncbi:hypothetical protein [Methanolobus sp. WCC4]|uniref:hypothetical protein n=1 Tax=Methanolobus sp. WCC4 TaxID=3125784 RepID=UPI0030F4C15D
MNLKYDLNPMKDGLINVSIKYCFFFIIIFALGNILVNLSRVYLFPNADIPLFWPISVFHPKILWPITLLPFNLDKINLLSAFISIALYSVVFINTILNLDKIKSKYLIYFIGAASISLSNLVHGIHDGLFYPIAGCVQNYYYDAIEIVNPYLFVSTYNQIQPELLTHSSTHPPGAVLLYYYLNQFLIYPEISSLFLMLISLSIVYFVYNLMRQFYEEKLSLNMTLIFIFIPAIQIYYLSSIDSIISLLFIGLIYYYLQLKSNKSLYAIIAIFIFTFISSFATYLVIYPIMAMYIDMLYKRNYGNMMLFGSMISIILSIYGYFNFDYIGGFLTASFLENPQGFRFFSEPFSYLFTRLENIAEIVLFYGPLLTIATYKGIRHNLDNECIRFILTFIILLLLFFFAGVARTGETARCCIFIYPLLLIPAAYFFVDLDCTVRFNKVKLILTTLWIQTLLMQTFGFYYW